MSKIYTGKLADRYFRNGTAFIKVRIGSGPTLDVKVNAGDEVAAGRMYGNEPVNYTYRGGRAFFVAA